MLTQLAFVNTGPFKDLAIDLAPRLNLLTGDNGLGKSFVLDVAWWMLTGAWAGEQAYPHRPRGSVLPASPATLSAMLQTREGKRLELKSTYDRRTQSWPLSGDLTGFRKNGATQYGVPDLPGLAVYARVDGSFTIWHGHHVTREPEDEILRLDGHEVWFGKDATLEGERVTLCNGLVRDWLDWEARYPAVFASFVSSLKALSAGEEMVPGNATRVRQGDARDIPTLDLPYGNVPITLTSAGMRRVLSLAYMLVWAWNEQSRNAELLGWDPAGDFVLLIDEVESHLHPQWQRVILPALFSVIGMLSPEVRVQVLAATHAPLVLASAEPLFDSSRDALWNFDLEGGAVQLEKDAWRRSRPISNSASG